MIVSVLHDDFCHLHFLRYHIIDWIQFWDNYFYVRGAYEDWQVIQWNIFTCKWGIQRKRCPSFRISVKQRRTRFLFDTQPTPLNGIQWSFHRSICSLCTFSCKCNFVSNQFGCFTLTKHELYRLWILRNVGIVFFFPSQKM